jgi:hypothetical protein
LKTRTLFFITALVVAASSWLSVVLYPSVLDFMGANPFWNGISEFGSGTDATVLPDLKEVAATNTMGALVVMPYVPYQAADLAHIKEFVNSGGTLVVMDDFGYGNQVLDAMGLDMRFAGVMLLDPYLNYRNERLPVINDFATDVKNAGINSLVLNHATAVTFPSGEPGGNYKILGRSSDTSFLDVNGDGVKSEGDISGPLAIAVKTNAGDGVVIAVSDPSILINSMAGLGDNSRFVSMLTSTAGKKLAVAVDASHLQRAALDRAKDTWAFVRNQLAAPWFLVLLACGVLVLSFIPVWRKGVGVER